ncbi:MAG: hypothetical protein ACQSGP_29665 [Frankia sp.]
MAGLAIVADDQTPRELVCSRERGTGARLVLPADAATLDGVRADWTLRGAVELSLEGRALVFRIDLDGRGIRITDPFSRMPIAVFRPARRGRGTVAFADGSVARWVAPDRWAFECGFVTPRGSNLVLFSHDGTAIMLVDEIDHEAGRAPDPVVMLALGWFLLWVGAATSASAASAVDPAVEESADHRPFDGGRIRPTADMVVHRGSAA